MSDHSVSRFIINRYWIGTYKSKGQLLRFRKLRTFCICYGLPVTSCRRTCPNASSENRWKESDTTISSDPLCKPVRERTGRGVGRCRLSFYTQDEGCLSETARSFGECSSSLDAYTAACTRRVSHPSRSTRASGLSPATRNSLKRTRYSGSIDVDCAPHSPHAHTHTQTLNSPTVSVGESRHQNFEPISTKFVPKILNQRL
jgi:hypothetical protein